MKARRLFVAAQLLSVLSHGVVFTALQAVLPPWPALGMALLLMGLCVSRLRTAWFDSLRPRWRVRCIDEPAFWLWAGAIFSLILFPLALLAAAPVAAVFDQSAKDVVHASAAACYALGLTLSGHGVWVERRRPVIRRLTLSLRGWPSKLDGYRIVQLSDLHIGSFDPKERGQSWVAAANSLSPDLAVVTGDLVTSGVAFYDDVAEVLAALRARDGVYVSMGNHDQWDNEKLVRALREKGLSVLANSWRLIERDGACFVLAGLDDPYTGKNDLKAALRARPEGVPTILLSHYPDFFEPARRLGVSLVLSGHTHGGQIGVPFLAERFNIATATGQSARGLFERDGAHLYVNAGLGTTGPPIRLGIPPEIAVIELRAKAS
jgi:hypothetical protein